MHTPFSARRRWLVAGALFGALLLVAGSFAVAQAVRTPDGPMRIAIDATPIVAFDNRDPTKVRFGRLEFRGGLALTSSSAVFGGISGIHMEPDGSRFIAISDRGAWLRGRIVYKDGKPAGIADTEMAPMLGPDGKTLAARGWYDTESLTESDGRFYVGIERADKIVRFDVRGQGFAARGEPIAEPTEFRSLAANKSLECLSAAPRGSSLAGRLVTVTERSLDAAGNLRAFVIPQSGGAADALFSVKRSDDFDISDCTTLGNDLLLLERRYSPARGVAMRIRRVPISSIRPGSTVDGATLVEADLGYQIDNMEGIAIHRNAQGETIFTLVSDDNFSAIQRNLLLQFALVAE